MDLEQHVQFMNIIARQGYFVVMARIRSIVYTIYTYTATTTLTLLRVCTELIQ